MTDSMLPSNTVNRDAGSSNQGSTGPAWTMVSTCTLALLGAAATALRFFFLARKPFWFDECFSVEVARLNGHDFVRLLWWREANMSLYYLLLRLWLDAGSAQAYGLTPFFVRSFSVMASLATLPAIFWLARKLFDRRVGVIAVALMACNAYSVRYAQEARSYSLFLLLAILASGFFVSYLREPSPRNRVGYILASVLAAYAHLYALLLVSAHWLSLRGLKREPESCRLTAISPRMRKAWIAIGVAILPLLAFVVKTGAGPIRWIPRPGFREVLDYFEHLAGNDGLPLLLLYAAAGVAAILPLGMRLYKPVADWEVWRVRFLLIWLSFPVALTVLLSLVRPIFLARYFIFCLPALIVLAAAGAASLRKPWMMGVCFAAMLLLSLQGTFSYYKHDFDLERDGSEASANYIYDHAQAGDAILFHIAEARIPYEFFVSLRQAEDARSSVTPGPEVIFPRHGDHLDYRDVTGNPSREFLLALPRKYARVWVVLMSNVASGHSDGTTLMLSQTLAGLYSRVEEVQFPRVEVRLYSKR